MSAAGPFVSPTAPVSPSPASNTSSQRLPTSEVTQSGSTRSQRILAGVREWATPVSILILAVSLLAYKFLPIPNGTPARVDGVALGRQYAPMLVGGYADSWDVAAKVVQDGKSILEAQKTFQDFWKASRAKSFAKIVTPAFSQVLPEGTEPKTDSDRAEVARLWHDFATGLRKGNRGAHFP